MEISLSILKRKQDVINNLEVKYPNVKVSNFINFKVIESSRCKLVTGGEKRRQHSPLQITFFEFLCRIGFNFKTMRKDYEFNKD